MPKGYFNEFGGSYIPEVLVNAATELEIAYKKAMRDKKFVAEYMDYLQDYAGRPTRLTFARNVSKDLGRNVFLKREDLMHTGSHKINNSLGQVMLAKFMGKERIVAETGAGQHGVATATACALLSMPCVVYMGAKDIQRQSLNVYRMKLMGAEVRSVSSGSKTLKDAINEAIRDWITHVKTTNYCLGSVVGPYPYPEMVRYFQSVIGKEVKRQMGKKPIHAAIACVGGGSNAIGLFHPLLKTKAKLIGVEAAGLGVNTKKHAATMTKGCVGVLHGFKSYILQDEHGQVQEAHSISAGLDYPGVGPEHAMLKSIKRVQYVSITDKEALKGFQYLSQKEGIIPALETSHAIAYLMQNPQMAPKGGNILLCVSGRGDKDVEQVSEILHL